MTVQRDRSIMEKAARMGDLYDFYASLLTDRQREWVSLHYLEDLSLAEIAEQFGVTRQAVHDNLRRAEEQLEAYDASLKLVKAHQRRNRLVTQLAELVGTVTDDVPRDVLVQLQNLIRALQSDA